MKSLPWADQDNYRISYDEQRVRIRVADINQLDQDQLLAAFTSRGLQPVSIIDVKSVAPPGHAADATAIAARLMNLQGEWRTDEEAEQKLYVNIIGDAIRLHTVTPGLWITTTNTIWEAGEAHLCFGKTFEKAHRLDFKHDGDECFVSIPFPSAFQGEFKVFRKKQRNEPAESRGDMQRQNK